jgi:predicted phosphodiesterase
MKIGVVSDTHKINGNGLIRVMEEVKSANAELIFHCGDIEREDVNPNTFLNLPVFCALVDTQSEMADFTTCLPYNWITTITKHRVIPFGYEKIYIGHRLGSVPLSISSVEFHKYLDDLRKEHEGLRRVFSGHTHFPFFTQTGLVDYVNPGAITGSISGYYEYAIFNTATNEYSFIQLYRTKATIEKFVVGVISDSSRISQIDPIFWQSLAQEFKKRGVKEIMHCGNLDDRDIGRPELADFLVHYNSLNVQKSGKDAPKRIPDNWIPIGRKSKKKERVVEIGGYRFCVQFDLGEILNDKSVSQTGSLRLELRREYDEPDFVLCGFTHNCLLMGGVPPYIINPGDIINDRNFATIELGQKVCITFGHVPINEEV